MRATVDWTMDFLRPANFSDALAIKAAHPTAVPVAGGTDVMVDINFGRLRPDALLDLNPVSELVHWQRDNSDVVIGAGLPYARLIDELGPLVPGLATAVRTIGSPQIRNRATIGGNLGSASPAGDCHPVLLAMEATIEVSSVRGARAIPAHEFFRGVKRSALEPDELIIGIRLPLDGGPCHFAKIGTRNAMVIAVCSFAVRLDPARRMVRTGIGSAAPTPIRALDAEALLAESLDWSASRLPDEMTAEFGARVAHAAVPIDDVRGTAGYRRHALSVLARRTLTWAWDDLTGGL